MSHQPAHRPVIDGFEFAAAGAAQQGTVAVAQLGRLGDLLASDAGEVAYRIEGTRDERGRPGLRLEVRGTLQLRCQRCLEPLPWNAEIDELLVLAATQAEIDADPVEAPDRVVAGKDMPVADLVEDELILALPYAPRHEACAAGAGAGAQKSASPFAALRGMLGDKH
jgi:uncharacterized protein